MNKNKKYTTILFDADDTLLDYKKAERNALIKVLEWCGITATKEIADRYSQINSGLWREFENGKITKEDIRKERFVRLFAEFGFTDTPAIKQINDEYLKFLGEGSSLIDGAFELCGKLKEEGYDLYIITNGFAPIQKKRLRESGIADFFTDVIVSETVGSQKPFTDFFDKVFEVLHEKDKSKILVVGDSLGSDIQGANNAGLPCVWFNPEHSINDRNLRINFEAETLAEIYDFLSE